MITHKTGNIFTSSAKVIGHGCNTLGSMGAGIAKTVQDKYPSIYQEYHKYCTEMDNIIGTCLLLQDEETGIYIANMFSQIKPGRDAKYTYLYHSLRDTLRQMNELQLNTLALPQIGAGIGGLDWESVQLVIEKVHEENQDTTNTDFNINNLEIELWTYNPDM